MELEKKLIIESAKKFVEGSVLQFNVIVLIHKL